MTSIDRCSQNVGYTFERPELLQEALTHRSAGSRNNERMEFLGDSVLNFVIAAELFRRFPQAAEGDLSRLRATLVKGDRLAEIASRLNLGEFLVLGSGELKSGGFRRSSILSDALEAIFGAVLLDGGFQRAHDLILNIYHDLLDSLPDVSQLKDPKTRLQEFLQARKLPLPEYVVAEVTGEAHRQVFTIACKVESLGIDTQGSGNSRRKAEQNAALQALGQLENA